MVTVEIFGYLLVAAAAIEVASLVWARSWNGVLQHILAGVPERHAWIEGFGAVRADVVIRARVRLAEKLGHHVVRRYMDAAGGHHHRRDRLQRDVVFGHILLLFDLS